MLAVKRRFAHCGDITTLAHRH